MQFEKKLDSSQVAAIALRDRLVKQILSEPDFEPVRNRIKELFEQGVDQRSIADILSETEPLVGRSEKVTSGVISEIVIATVNEKIRFTFINTRRTDRVVSLKRELTKDERVKGKVIRGYIIWTPEEDEYFFNILVVDPRFRRKGGRGRMNHGMLAAAMNAHFQTEKFNAQTCLGKYRNRNRADDVGS